jgi:predicted translin family RNA/ssDNA-binding protein
MHEDLLKLCEATRYQFLKVDLQVCRSAVDMGVFELGVGNLEGAKREVESVEKAICTVERFLPGIPEDKRRELEAELAEVKEGLAAFKSSLK